MSKEARSLFLSVFSRYFFSKRTRNRKNVAKSLFRDASLGGFACESVSSTSDDWKNRRNFEKKEISNEIRFFDFYYSFYLAKIVAFFFLFFGVLSCCDAAVYRTPNFSVDAENSELAKKIGDAAERYRESLAIVWLGQKLPRWSSPCIVTVKASPRLGAGGETVFTFADGEVYDWKMSIQGSEERLLDSVLPHEITHTILASHLRAPAPRWLDEGIATSVEANVERMHYRRMLSTFLHSKKGIAFNDMVAMKEYPDDLMPFYSQSFSICEYLILVGGRRRLIEFAKTGCESKDWNAALRKHYDCRSLGALQLEWIDWVARWDAANMPAELPPTRKLRDFNDWENEDVMLANLNASTRREPAFETAFETTSGLASGLASGSASGSAFEPANELETVAIATPTSAAFSDNAPIRSSVDNDATRLARGQERTSEFEGTRFEANESGLVSARYDERRRNSNSTERGAVRSAVLTTAGTNGATSAAVNVGTALETSAASSVGANVGRSDAISVGANVGTNAALAARPSVGTVSPNGVKWRSGADCLIDGAGSATRIRAENPNAGAENLR